jgi:hypothetical protein
VLKKIDEHVISKRRWKIFGDHEQVLTIAEHVVRLKVEENIIVFYLTTLSIARFM